MEKQLEQLKSDTHRAESDFQEAVRYYLLNPLETPGELLQALTQLFDSVTRYRIILDKLRNHLNTLHGSEPLIARQDTIKRAIVNLNVRDTALERLLKRISLLAVEHAPRQN